MLNIAIVETKAGKLKIADSKEFTIPTNTPVVRQTINMMAKDSVRLYAITPIIPLTAIDAPSEISNDPNEKIKTAPMATTVRITD